MLDHPVGIIAAGGRLPVAAAQGIRNAGRQVVCIGLRGQYDADLPQYCDKFKIAGLIQLGRWIKLLHRFGCREALMLGKVEKVRMYDPFLWLRYMPDVTAGKVWLWRLRHDKRPDSLLGAVADELQQGGIMMIDSTRYIPQLLADEGVMTRVKPSSVHLADINFALPIIQQMAALDIGQSIAVNNRDIIAVEAIEGTDAMIQRAGSLCRRGKWTLLKIAKPDQDMRFDVPTVGLQTIITMKANGATCLAVEAGRTIILDKLHTLAQADELGIAVIGVKVQSPVTPS